jgi:F-type H+-transporting ATPase subunit b|tara:strand:- start:196 stop:699 length:504 start_codon:yes stop_codon:yes gene_type:complete
MGGLFTALGVDTTFLIANLINFLILVGILYKFGYKPILKFAKERQDKIEKGIKDAELAEKKLNDAEAKGNKQLSSAHRESQLIVGKAKEQAKLQADAMLKKTQVETKHIIDRAKKEIRLEQDKSIIEAKKEIASLTLLVTEKLMRKKIDAQVDKTFIEQTLKDTTND